jgi:uncharacterized membrane protein YwaF
MSKRSNEELERIVLQEKVEKIEQEKREKKGEAKTVFILIVLGILMIIDMFAYDYKGLKYIFETLKPHAISLYDWLNPYMKSFLEMDA